MKRPVLLIIAIGVVVAVAVLLTSMSHAEPVELRRSDVTVRLDRASAGTVAAQVEVPAEAAAVSLFATMPQMGHMTAEIVATKEKPGLFRVTGELFSMPGRWELGVRVDSRVVTFEITVK